MSSSHTSVPCKTDDNMDKLPSDLSCPGAAAMLLWVAGTGTADFYSFFVINREVGHTETIYFEHVEIFKS